MITSMVTQKGQTTIPLPVRKELNVAPGDQIVYENTPAGFLIRKARPFDAAWHAGVETTLAAEWNSAEDEEDYRDL